MSISVRLSEKRRLDTIDKIQAYYKTLPVPFEVWNDRGFKQRSYARTAVTMVIDEVKNSSLPPELIVSQFIRRMDDYSTRNKANSFMFSVLHDTAQDLYDHVFLS